jgi:hypothetical protein
MLLGQDVLVKKVIWAILSVPPVLQGIPIIQSIKLVSVTSRMVMGEILPINVFYVLLENHRIVSNVQRLKVESVMALVDVRTVKSR